MHLLKPDLRGEYPMATDAVGSVVRNADGREWLDGASGAIACSIGHGHPAVLSAIAEQLARAAFLYRTQFTSEPAEKLARRLCERLGYAAAFFVNSGSEAVETGVRIAQQYWRELGRTGKQKILSRKLSYHGATVGALSLSGHWPRRRACGASLDGEPTLPTPHCARCPLGLIPAACGLACAAAVEAEILKHGADRVAAVLIEPVVGASGAAIVPPTSYLSRVRQICDKHGVLLIADEVLTGLGRVGLWLGMDLEAVKADIVCLGKGLNAGYLPISGVLVAADIRTALVQGSGCFPLGHTHSNHPVAAAAANAVLDVLESEGLVTRAHEMGLYLGRSLDDLLGDRDRVGEVRGLGMFWAVELVIDRATNDPFPPSAMAASAVVRTAFDLGLIVYPAAGFIGGVAGDAVIIAPPLNVSLGDVDRMVDRLTRSIDRLP